MRLVSPSGLVLGSTALYLLCYGQGKLTQIQTLEGPLRAFEPAELGVRDGKLAHHHQQVGYKITCSVHIKPLLEQKVPKSVAGACSLMKSLSCEDFLTHKD